MAAGFGVLSIVLGIIGFVVAVLILRFVLGTGTLIKQGDEILVLLRKIVANLAPEAKATEAIPKSPDYSPPGLKIETPRVKLAEGPFQTAIVDLDTGETVVDAEGHRYKIIDFRTDGLIVLNEAGVKMELKASGQQTQASKRTFAVRKARDAGVEDLP